jgi:hypothetical protein
MTGVKTLCAKLVRITREKNAVSSLRIRSTDADPNDASPMWRVVVRSAAGG